jgi:hypothetical protein
MEQSYSKADSISASQKNSPPFMETESSLPSSQNFITGPDLEPLESIPQLATYF